MFQLNNKIAVVTGGGSGIGKAVSKLLAQQGAHVMVVDLNAAASEETVKEIHALGQLATAVPLDVTDKAAVDKTLDAFEKIQILVNCAGVSHIGNLLSTSAQDLQNVFDVNVKGMYHCLQAGVRKMLSTGGGVIVNISSIAAKVGISDRFAYSMSKGAVHAMTLSIAKDYIHQNIRCNSISPGRVHTPFVDGFLKKNYPGKEAIIFDQLAKSQPIGRMGQPIEIAHQVLYLCSEEASFITGSDFSIDGGFVTLNS